MKKLHKLGTTILLSLTPAAALGITAGIVVANLPKGDEIVETTKDDWFKEYKDVNDAYQANDLSFNNDEVSVKYNDENLTFYSINDRVWSNVRNTVLDAYIKDAYVDLAIAGPLCSDLKAAATKAENEGFTCTYIKCNAYLLINIPCENNGYTKYKFDRNGFILSYDNVDSNGSQNKFEVTYLKKPHLVTTVELIWVEKYGEYYSPAMQVREGKEYTLKFKDWNKSIDGIYMLDRTGSYPYPNCDLTNIDVTGLPQGSTWNWDSSNKMININPPAGVNPNDIQVKFSLASGTGNLNNTIIGANTSS